MLNYSKSKFEEETLSVVRLQLFLKIKVYK